MSAEVLKYTREQVEALEIAPGTVHENLEGWVPALASEDDLRLALEKAFDYRGDVTITETSQVSGAETGFLALGVQVVIDAPPASVADPLRLVFRLHASVLPAGVSVADVEIFQDGTAVAARTGAPSAVPDPCVLSRQLLADGAVEIVVLASAASGGGGGGSSERGGGAGTASRHPAGA